MIDYKSIEEKWQKAWSEAKIFEVEPNDKKPLLVTSAFPYVNSPPHIGHARTYGTADAYARYMRMRGFNVLYPMAFHATGTPLLAFAKRINGNDKELIDELKVFHIPEEDIRQMTDPKFIADYFVKEMESGMRISGYGIDWRRKFVSIEPLFSKFVEWQFEKLKEKGYLTKGKHPIGWCTNDNNAVGQHDTKHDVQPEIQPMTVVKFKDASSEVFFACATYRPETLYGVTNIFVNENIEYVIAKIDNQRYYLSKDAAENLKYQFELSVEGTISGKELLSKMAINPINNSEVPILPGFFVKSDIGTGVVMSVPAHAPFDYVALQRLKRDNYPMPEMQYTKVLEIENSKGVSIGRSISDVTTGQVKPLHPDMPALAYLEILHTDENAIDDMIEFATKLLYREESHWGIMILGEYKGMKEPEAREKIKEKLENEKSAFEMYVISNDEPVYCRCGYKVIVKIVDDQWFINYGDKAWKASVRNMFNDIVIRPEKLRLTFDNIIEWIDLRAAERRQGLGTKFPLNPEHIIESLSDSTIYMCFYTFIHILRAEKIEPEQLKPKFFDYVILGKGDIKNVESATGINEPAIQKCKESFDYWYGNTSRHSALDLVPNHLTMYVFNHVGILNKTNWPKRIVVNGFVNYEGEKMSKSLGNIVPLVDGIKNGADPLRFILIAGADLDTTTEFSSEGISSVHSRNEFIYRAITSLQMLKSKELSHIDYWLYSKLNSKIKDATVHMDFINLKGAYTEIFYNSVNDLKKYIERNGENEIVVRDFLESITLMLAPSMPHVAEEFWSGLGKTTFVAQERWPEFDEQMINLDEELVEEIIDQTVADIKQGIDLTAKMPANSGKKVKEIRLIIADQWKTKAYNMLVKDKSIALVTESSEFESIGKEKVAQFLSPLAKRMSALMVKRELDNELIVKAFFEASDYIASKFDSKVIIETESESKSARAARAFPEKPSIDLIWD